ncbi:MAG: hypothetical protein NWR97_00965 [Salibacteraceae bacterium]|nr:hypothetical protein [Salibacteraceae bacterium]
MKKWLQHFFLFSAGLIILLHSIVPHRHTTENHSDQALIENIGNDLSSFISFVFHEDLGQGHLEEYPTPFPLFVETPNQVELKEVIQPITWVSFVSPTTIATVDGFEKGLATRGPPALA